MRREVDAPPKPFAVTGGPGCISRFLKAFGHRLKGDILETTAGPACIVPDLLRPVCLRPDPCQSLY